MTLALARLPEGVLPRFPVASPQILSMLHDQRCFHQLLRANNLPSPQTEPLNIVATDELSMSVMAEHGCILAHMIHRRKAVLAHGYEEDQQALRLAKAVVAAANFHGLARFVMRTDPRDGSLYAWECQPCAWESSLSSSVAASFIRFGHKLVRANRASEILRAREHQSRGFLSALLRNRRAPFGTKAYTLPFGMQVYRDAWIQVAVQLSQQHAVQVRERRARPGHSAV
jgi:hypothetical protein